MTLEKARLPQAVEVNGSLFRIHTDFKFFLRLSKVLQQKGVKTDAVDFMYIDEKPADRNAGIKALIDFMQPARELPRRTADDTGEIVLDYDTDAEYIYAAFFEQYGIDIIDTPLHWHKFLALLHGLHDTELNRIIEIRLFTPDGTNNDYNKRMQRKKEAWALPQPEQTDEAYEEFAAKLRG